MVQITEILAESTQVVTNSQSGRFVCRICLRNEKSHPRELEWLSDGNQTCLGSVSFALRCLFRGVLRQFWGFALANAFVLVIMIFVLMEVATDLIHVA